MFPMKKFACKGLSSNLSGPDVGTIFRPYIFCWYIHRPAISLSIHLDQPSLYIKCQVAPHSYFKDCGHRWWPNVSNFKYSHSTKTSPSSLVWKTSEDVQVSDILTPLSGLEFLITVMSHEHHGISNHQQIYSLFNSSFSIITEKTQRSTLLAKWKGNLQVTGGFPTQRAINAESLSMSMG